MRRWRLKRSGNHGKKARVVLVDKLPDLPTPPSCRGRILGAVHCIFAEIPKCSNAPVHTSVVSAVNCASQCNVSTGNPRCWMAGSTLRQPDIFHVGVRVKLQSCKPQRHATFYCAAQRPRKKVRHLQPIIVYSHVSVARQSAGVKVVIRQRDVPPGITSRSVKFPGHQRCLSPRKSARPVGTRGCRNVSRRSPSSSHPRYRIFQCGSAKLVTSACASTCDRPALNTPCSSVNPSRENVNFAATLTGTGTNRLAVKRMFCQSRFPTYS